MNDGKELSPSEIRFLESKGVKVEKK